ncbi:MAG TPA: VOC family protein, partial [Gemmatimonadaceae bacterium]|nr:VOC family protein [Gemmatimonadaceae bacterium]
MIRTLGLTHLALTVSDLERSFQFYHDVFGMLAIYREPAFIQAQTPGSRDVLVLETGDEQVGESGGIK